MVVNLTLVPWARVTPSASGQPAFTSRVSSLAGMKPAAGSGRKPTAEVPSQTQRPATLGEMEAHCDGSGWLSSAVRGIIGLLKVTVTITSVGTSLAPTLGKVRKMVGA